ncbi:hypothetical protein GCM10010377_80080 [Streptomyces viridiviolaceus]|nr:hypothetical protein GCM10010377_80080 [Streptomyces viridiviolaceus]
MQVPDGGMAAVEGAYPAVDALDVLGEGLSRSVLRHGLHPTMVRVFGAVGVRPGAVYEVRKVVPRYYRGAHEFLGPR